MLDELVDGIATPAALRDRLRTRFSTTEVAWIHVAGLSTESGAAHQAFQSGLRRTGLHGDLDRQQAKVIVLDWTHATEFHADGLAFGAVVLRALADRGIAVVCCPAVDSHVASALASADCDAWRGPTIRWLPTSHGPPRGTGPAMVLAPVTMFGGSHGTVLVESALTKRELALERRGWNEVPLLSELMMEIVQNVQSHADAAHAALSAVLLRRRRPECLQIGVADNGVGIPASMLTQPRYAWLESYAPGRVTATVLDRHLTRRDGQSAGQAGSGGVMSALLGAFLDMQQSTLTIRSGAGTVTITTRKPKARLGELTYGLGTQYLLTVRQPSR